MYTLVSYNDNELVQLIRQNDINAFTELYNRYWEKMFQTANAVLHNPDTSGDIVQDIFTSLWERRHALTIEFPTTYLMQAVRFQVLKAIKANKASSDLNERLQDASLSILCDNVILFKELEEILNNVIERLPDEHRKIFLLNRQDGLSYKEIATAMNISHKTVEKKISGSLKQIRVALDKAFQLSHLFFF